MSSKAEEPRGEPEVEGDLSEDDLDGVAGGLTTASGLVMSFSDDEAARRKTTKSSDGSSSDNPGDNSGTITTSSGLIFEMED